MMITAQNARSASPTPDDVRAQVERMTASTTFANSPQLSAFLLFVVEAELRGKGERLKGYTIGVEVLRRDVSFDPQIDPIVRVEATRLRRAIERYYSGPGASDTVIVDLPRGGYVPRFHWRETAKVAPVVAPIETSRAFTGNGLPTLRVAPFVVAGEPGDIVVDGDSLSVKLCEAFALFDAINVVAAAPAGGNGRVDYRLDGTVEYRGDGRAALRFRLIDKSDETVLWSRVIERPADADAVAFERGVILELATTVVEPYGIIWANDRARHLSSDAGDPRYRALIHAGEAFRSFDIEDHAQARAELEQLTAADPSFATGFSYLSIIYAREYQYGYAGRSDGAAPLDRALRVARRGVELKPQSARAYHLLSIVLFYRGEIDAACATADRAIAMNPYDLLMRSDYGGRLIFAGEIERGMEILQRTIEVGVVMPPWTHFYLFLGHYLRDELPEARYQAGQLTTEAYLYGLIARALVTYRDGQIDDARHAADAILELQPEWGTDARRELGKMITDGKLADRLAHDLAAAGLKNE